jgi:putative transposase
MKTQGFCAKIVFMMSATTFICGWIRVMIKLSRPGGVKAIAAENMVLRQQLIKLSRHHKRSPKLKISERILFGLLASWINPRRLFRIAIILKPATILKFHRALVKRKYHLLFSNKTLKKPGRKGPSGDLIQIILEMKKRNPRYGYLRIAMQIKEAFGIELDEGVVRRVLQKNFKDTPKDDGPSWLTFIGQMKDSLWSVDFFCCESIFLKTHWVMVVIDQFSREIIGFSVHAGDLNGVAVCCMFNKIIFGKKAPKYLSTDHDPLFRFKRWQSNLRILDVEEIKSVPYTPISHPFVERLIGTTRREYLDHTLFFNSNDLQNKLVAFQCYYNNNRGHSSLDRTTPVKKANEKIENVISINSYRWEKVGRGLFDLPIAA